MPNSFELVTVFRDILQGIYRRESLTAPLDAAIQTIGFEGTNAVRVFKTSMVGLGNYSRATGYPAGDVTGTWQTLTLAVERGRAFSIDRMDDDETLGMAFGTLASEFYRTMVVPEIDAVRFSKYASCVGIQEVGTPALLSSSTIRAAIGVAKAALNAAEVPMEGRIMYMSDSCYGFLEDSIGRTLQNQTAVETRVTTFDGMQVVMVPQTRFFKGITLNPGSTANVGGFAKTASTGRDINFMILHPSSVLQPIKLEVTKIFSPEVNQTTDGWLIQSRLYHDAFVHDNRVQGIYSHIKNS